MDNVLKQKKCLEVAMKFFNIFNRPVSAKSSNTFP